MTDPERRRLAAFWDSSRAYYEQAAATNVEAAPERTFLLRHLDGEERLLDLGCGSCENAQWVPPGCRYVGVDVSTVALAMAAESGRRGARVRGDGTVLPFAGASFDAVLSTWAVEHFHDPGRVFAEVARVLRRDGLLLLVGSAWDLPYEMPPSLDPRRRLEVTARRLGRQLGDFVSGRHRFDVVRAPLVLERGYVPDADAVHVVQGSFLVRYLEALGFRIVERRRLPHAGAPRGARRLLRRLVGSLPPWRFAWGSLLVVARLVREPRRPSYRLRYL
jgi:SAM-dependent methyltransferase